MKELKERFAAVLKQMRDIAAKAEDDGRDFDQSERDQIAALQQEAQDLKAQIEAAQGDDDLRAAIKALGDGVDLADRKPAGEAVEAGKGRSLGERFVSAPEYGDWLKHVAPNGQIPDSAKGIASPPVKFNGAADLGLRRRKDLITGASDTSAGAIVYAQDLGLADEGAIMRPLTLFDLITMGQTGSDQVTYARVTSFTNAAEPTAEATAATGTSGTKPESAMALERVTESVKTMAHWIPATKRALSDAGQVRTLVDQFLRYGLREELEDQILTGDGTGENFTGISNVSGVQAQAFDTDLLTTYRKAKTKVRTVGRASATGFAMHPNDAEALDLLKDGQQRFYFGGPADDGIQRLWRLPVVESEAIPEGTAYVGDWRQAVLWDREQASIQVSDSHSDFFVRNLVAILAEMRAAFGILRPSAFVEIALS